MVQVLLLFIRAFREGKLGLTSVIYQIDWNTLPGNIIASPSVMSVDAFRGVVAAHIQAAMRFYLHFVQTDPGTAHGQEVLPTLHPDLWIKYLIRSDDAMVYGLRQSYM